MQLYRHTLNVILMFGQGNIRWQWPPRITCLTLALFYKSILYVDSTLINWLKCCTRNHSGEVEQRRNVFAALQGLPLNFLHTDTYRTPLIKCPCKKWPPFLVNLSLKSQLQYYNLSEFLKLTNWKKPTKFWIHNFLQILKTITSLS